MPYKITIEKIEDVVRKRKGDWCVVDRRPYTDAEINQANEGFQSSVDSQELKDVFGYAPDREVVSTDETKILEQTVDDLDIQTVIKAINGID